MEIDQEFIGQFKARTGNALIRNHIFSEKDLYAAIERGVRIRGFGQSSCDEVNKFVSRKIRIVKPKPGNEIKFADEA